MTYLPLTNPSKLIDWARTLISNLNQRDTAQDKKLADIIARLDAGGL